MAGNIRQNIPDAWAEHACCPLCGSPKMRVQHAAASVDQMLCTACGLAFELEMEGDRLIVTQWPVALPFLHVLVPDDCWRTAGELRSLVKQMTSGPGLSAPVPPVTSSLPPPPAAPAKAMTAPRVPDSARPSSRPPVAAPQPAPPPLNPDAIGIRIKQLRALGNSPKEIRTTLTQAEKDPERVRAILGIIAQSERQEQARQGKKLAWSLGILAVIVIILVGAGIVYQENVLKQNQLAAAGGAGPTLQPTQAPNLAVKLLNLNTPVVNYGSVPPVASGTGVSAVTCPRTADQAANLFGARPADWYYPPGSNGWVMAHAGGTSATIFVPKGMKAAYLQLSNKLTLIEVEGPVTLSNTYYVAISCP